jgi:hemerythrin-like domain-containing protein
MAKRHPSLVPLSQDHHHGLALALRLRQGDRALLNDGWTHDRDEQARRVVKFYEDELRKHFKAEEDAVFPIMEKYISGSSPTIELLRRQHRTIERLVADIQHSHGAQLELCLVTLGELLENHIRIEERELFEVFQVQLSEHIICEVGVSVAQIHGRVPFASRWSSCGESLY